MVGGSGGGMGNGSSTDDVGADLGEVREADFVGDGGRGVVGWDQNNR
jgi:hypothetical protein